MANSPPLHDHYHYHQHYHHDYYYYYYYHSTTTTTTYYIVFYKNWGKTTFCFVAQMLEKLADLHKNFTIYIDMEMLILLVLK